MSARFVKKKSRKEGKGMKNTNKKLNMMFLYAIGIVALACAFLALLLNFSSVKAFVLALLLAFKPIVYALLFVFCVGGMVNTYYAFFEKRIVRGKRTALCAKVISVVLGYVTFLMIIAALLIIVVLPLINSYSDILNRIPSYLGGAVQWLEQTISSIPILSGQSDKIMEYIGESLDFSYDSIRQYLPVAMDMLNNLLSEMSSILIGLIISIYIICSRAYISKIRERLVGAFLSDDSAERVHLGLVRIYGFFADFFSGRLLYSLIIGIVFYIVLWIMDIPLYSFISIMIGVLVFVPVVGTMLAALISTFFVFITSYNLVLWFFCVFVVILLAGYLVLQRYIVKPSVRTTVTASLISVLVLSGLFGTVGAILAIPVYLSAKMFFGHLLVSLERKRAAKVSESDDDELDDVFDDE